MDIVSIVEQYKEYGVERRRYYHARPELSGKEIETCNSIEQDLRDIGITDIKRMTTCHGLIADVHGAKEGKTIALRADIDALNVEEKTGLPYAATNGCMHACGHDMHIAILLETAKLLFDHRDELAGTVRLIIQPMEELALGAKAMIAEGVLSGVDAIYANHILSDIPVGKVWIADGPEMASAHYFKIEVEGVSGHGSAPQTGVDAVTVSAAIINSLQQVVSRMNDPAKPLVLTIGNIHGGTRFNIIANHVTMEGTVRTFEPGTLVEERMRRVIDNTAASFGAKASLQYDYITLPLLNDPALAAVARNSAAKALGKDVLASHAPIMSGDDFAFFNKMIPGVFAIIGSTDVEYGHIYSNHHEKYSPDEKLLQTGTTLMAQFATDFLNQQE